MLNSTHGPSAGLSGVLAIRAGLAAGAAPSPGQAIWLVAGATAGGMLPDADHHCSSTAKVWGPITSIPCRWFGRMVGGHRAGSHDLSKGAPVLFAAVFAVGMFAPRIVEWAFPPAGTSVGDYARVVAWFTGMATTALIAGLCFVALAPFIPGRWEGNGAGNLVMSWFTAFWVMHFVGPLLAWQSVAMAAAGMALGATTAIIQDGCTISGIPMGTVDKPYGKPDADGQVKVRVVERTVHLLPAEFRVRTGSAFERHFIRLPVMALLVWQSFELASDLGAFGHPFAL